MGWESFRVDVAGAGITVTADDSNLFRDRDGKLNGNTGDTDASGLNVTDATDSVIFGSESADEAPYQTLADALVELAGGRPEPAADDDEDADVEDLGDEEQEADEPLGDVISASTARATASAVVAPADDDDAADEGWDFPYDAWVSALDPDVATAVNTDEGTTLASGADAVAVGGDGYDDDDIRAAGSDITITRDDGNVVLGGTGDVNAQIGDSEQGAVIMDVERTFIRGGGAY